MQQQTEGRAKYQNYVELKQMKMKYQVKPEVIALTHKPKFMYVLFNLFELEVNRFANLEEFKILAKEIVDFNQEIDDWKKRNIEIKNLYLTYHLYQNLFSRMKFVSNLVLDRGEGKRAYQDIAHWYFQQKPKVRNKAPEKEEARMKPSTATKDDDTDIDRLLVSNINKREMKVYEAMARTVHADFFPPKERLLQYKRKDLLQGFNPETQRRASSTSSLSKTHSKYRGSFASTRASLKKTITTTELKKEDEKIEPVVIPFEVTENQDNEAKPEEQMNNAEIVELEKEKMVQQEQILQKNIVQVVHEEDQQDGEEQVLSEDEKKDDKNFKKYKLDHNADEDMQAEENIKDSKQSTLRRILKQKQEAIRVKLEELNVAQQMGNWAAIKSRQSTDEHRKLERLALANKYNQLQYVPKTFEERQSSRKKEIPEYPMMLRSKSSHPGSIQNEIQKLKINNALKTYAKYIQHVEIKPIIPETEQQQEEMRLMRSTSLTSFCRQGKRTPFSKIFDIHGTERYNEDAQEQMLVVKDRLAKKIIPVQKKQILNGLGIVNVSAMESIDPSKIYPPQKTLFNNPFFPKHLYQTKPKKKKK